MCHRGHKAPIPGNPTLRHDIIRSPRERRALARCGRRQMIKAGKGSDTYNYNDGCRPGPRGKRPDSEDLPMGRTALDKLRSRKGASLTFALLAFLVCAVISAVLLASASAATGRLSNLAETDQRYYAVTSAAQLFCDELEGQQFTIERTHTNYQVKIRGYYTNIDGNVFGFTPGFDDDDISYWFGESVKKKNNLQNVYTFYAHAAGLDTMISDEALDPDTTPNLIYAIRSNSLLANAALTYLLGVPPEGTEGPKECSAMLAFEQSPGEQFEIKKDGAMVKVDEIDFGKYILDFVGDTPKGVDHPKITAVASLRKDGSIVIEFSNGDDPEKPYKVTVTLSAEVTDNSDLPITISSDSTYFRFDPGTTTSTPCSYECTLTTTVKTKTTTIRWHVTDIKKGAA